MIGIGAREKWPPGERKSPGAAATASEAKDVFHRENLYESWRYCKPVPLGEVVAAVLERARRRMLDHVG